MASGGDSTFSLGGNLFCFLLIFCESGRSREGQGRDSAPQGLRMCFVRLCIRLYLKKYRLKNKNRITLNFP